MKVFRCKTCGHLHLSDDMPEKCLECGKADFEMVLEQKAVEGSQLPQISMENFKTLVTETVNKALEPMTKVDRKHAVFPGQNDDDLKNMDAAERTIKFFRHLFKGEVSSARDIWKQDVEKAADLIAKFQRTTLDETTDAQGAVLVPTEFAGEVFRIAETYGIARRDCRIMPMRTKSKDVQTLASGVTAYWPGEGVAITKGEPTFGEATLTAKKVAALIANTEELFEDSGIELYGLLTELTAEAISEQEDNQLFQGDGSSPSIYGILTKTGVNAVTLDTGNISFANVDLDKIRDLPNSLTGGARKGGKFYLHYNILTHLAKLKDNDGRYTWLGPNGAYPDNLVGWPYEASEEMPSDSDDAADTPFACFGNLKKAVVFGDRKQLSVKLLEEGRVGSENLGEECKTALRFYERIDILVVIATALARLKTAAS